MSPELIFTVFAILLLSGSLFYLFFYRSWRRKRELQQPFPKPWRSYLKKQVPAYKRLAPQQQKRLERLVQLFVSEKDYYGCDGFEDRKSTRLNSSHVRISYAVFCLKKKKKKKKI